MKDKIQQLRDLTSLGILDCKNALDEAGGDIDKAVIILRKKGQSVQVDRSSKTTKCGEIHTYSHLGKIGVMVEFNCETDFVAQTADWAEFVRDIALQVASMNPTYVDSTEIPTEELDKEKEIIVDQARQAGKPENIIEKW